MPALRILWISPGFTPDESNLNCIPPLQFLARELSNRGVDLQILSLNFPHNDERYFWHGIPVYPFGSIKNRWLRWLTWVSVLKAAGSLHRAGKFDVIHSFWLGPCWLLGRYLQKKWRVPHFTTLMGQDVLKTNRYLHFLSRKEAANLIAVSKFQNECLVQSVGFAAGKCIPWGLAREDMPASYPDHRPLDVLGCGSLIPLKDWNLWLEVMVMLVRWNPGLKAEIIGEGPERINIENQIHKYRLGNHVTLQGSLSRPAVLEKMRKAKVFLHTSSYESFGYVLAEAAANGCHVVSTPVGIARDLASCGNTAEALLNHLVRLLVLPPPSGPVPVKTMDEVAAKYLDLYEDRK